MSHSVGEDSPGAGCAEGCRVAVATEAEHNHGWYGAGHCSDENAVKKCGGAGGPGLGIVNGNVGNVEVLTRRGQLWDA